MRADDEFVLDDPHNAETSGPLPIPSFPEISNEWRYAGSRYQGPNRAFSPQGASSYEEHINQLNEVPFPTDASRSG